MIFIPTTTHTQTRISRAEKAVQKEAPAELWMVDFIRTSKSRCSVYFKAFKPLIINWNTVFKFSGDGAVTNIFEYPYDTAPVIERNGRLNVRMAVGQFRR
jgi:hypothetical protein